MRKKNVLDSATSALPGFQRWGNVICLQGTQPKPSLGSAASVREAERRRQTHGRVNGAPQIFGLPLVEVKASSALVIYFSL